MERRIGRLLIGWYWRDWFIFATAPMLEWIDRVPHQCGLIVCVGPVRLGWRWLTVRPM